MTTRIDSPPDLSVVIPAYNEEGRIGSTIERLVEYLRGHVPSFEILVVDDGSTDSTRTRAEEVLRGIFEGRIIARPENGGKGLAVKTGVLASAGRLIFFTDADLSTPIEELEKFLPLIEGGYDVVIGSRALPGSDIQIPQSRTRRLMGKIFNLFVRVLVMRGIPDTQCGFKLFRREAARAVFSDLKIRGFAFDVEALFRAHARGLRIAQVPVVWRDSSPSKVRMLRSSVQMLAELWKIRRIEN